MPLPQPQADPTLRHTALYALHVERGGRMVPFAGYEMPVHYAAGIIKEHLQTRRSAGLFDVSHMGQLMVRPRSGQIVDAARAIETLMPVDLLDLGVGRQRYALFTDRSEERRVGKECRL